MEAGGLRLRAVRGLQVKGHEKVARQVALRLATRYEACQILEPSIALVRFTLRQVEMVLERDDDEPLGSLASV